jgi:hypothetical protein
MTVPGIDSTCCPVSRLTLYTRSGRVILAVLSRMIAVPPLIALAGRLPAHPQMPGDVRPGDPSATAWSISAASSCSSSSRWMRARVIFSSTCTGDSRRALCSGLGGAAGARCR